MKVRIIGNSLAVQGFQLAGIRGWVVESTQQAQVALEALSEPDINMGSFGQQGPTWALTKAHPPWVTAR